MVISISNCGNENIEKREITVIGEKPEPKQEVQVENQASHTTNKNPAYSTFMEDALVPGTNENNKYYPINKCEIYEIDIGSVCVNLFGDYTILSIKGEDCTVNVGLYPKYRPEIDGPGFNQSLGSKIEFEYENNIEIEPFYFNYGIKKSKLKDIDIIDSLVLSEFDVADIQFKRKALTSFNNYFILINIEYDRDKARSNLLKSSEYFIKQDGENVWDYKNSSMEKIVKSIYDNTLQEVSIVEMYNKTTEILNNIVFKYR